MSCFVNVEVMKAAVYRAVDDVRCEEIARFPEIGDREVLVRIDTCGVCGTDLKKIHTGSHSGSAGFRARDGWDDCGCRSGKTFEGLRGRRTGDGVSPHSVW